MWPSALHKYNILWRLQCNGDKNAAPYQRNKHFTFICKKFSDARVTKSKVMLHLIFFQQRNLYPTVGLQTPGEIIDANFGQQPFVFDIEELRKVRICFCV